MLFSQKKAFLIFLEMKRSTFQARLKKRKFYTSGNGNPEKNLFYFLKRKLFLYLGKRTARRNLLYFRKQNFLIYPETETLQNFIDFRK